MLWAILGGLGLFLIVALLGIAAGFNILRSAFDRLPSPQLREFASQQPSLPPTEEPSLPSPLASDEALINLRGEINSLRGQVNSLDVFEPQISPPNLDLDITIVPR